MKRIYNILVGFTITFAKGVLTLMIAAMFFDKSIMNYDNTLFLCITSLFGWVISGVYYLDVKILFRGIIHSLSLYAFSIGSSYFIYGIGAIEKYIVTLSVVYFVCYLICYIAGYYYYKKMDADMNDTVEYLRKFEKLVEKEGE